MNEDLLETNGLQNMLKVINTDRGSGSLTNSADDPKSEDSFDKLVKFASWGLRPLFDVYISSNPKDPESYVVRVRKFMKKNFFF